MLKLLQKRFALSQKGASDFLKGVVWTTVMDLVLMLPAVFMFLFLSDYFVPILDTEKTITHGLLYYILLGIAFMFVMYLVAKIQYCSTYLTVYNESENRRINLAEKLRKLPLAFFGKKDLSDLTSTIMADSTELEHTFSHAVPQLFASILSLILCIIGLFFYNASLAIALFWVVPFGALILLISKKKQREGNNALYLIKRQVSENIQEGLEGIQEIKAYNQEDAFIKKLDLNLDAYEKQLTKGELFVGGLVHSAHSLLKLGLVSVVLLGAKMLALGDLDLFTYLIFLIVASRIYAPIGEVLTNIAVLFYLDIRIERMNEMNSLPVQKGAKHVVPNNFDITFNNISFYYNEDKQVLRNVSFIAKQGKITALVGPSGSGKTTAVKLAARFWDISSGKILLGGYDISKIDPEALLQHYSIVFQDVVLFNTSILNNIRIGKRDASDEEVLQAAKLARCDEFVKKMSKGYNTVIGENGETLSGGERQRISIARALLKNAPIVLLDEATASLDVENESKIQEGISELIKNKTVIIIAHRMRTIANADNVIVLDNGEVVEAGIPKELKQKNGIFVRMLNRQMVS